MYKERGRYSFSNVKGDLEVQRNVKIREQIHEREGPYGKGRDGCFLLLVKGLTRVLQKRFLGREVKPNLSYKLNKIMFVELLLMFYRS